MLPGLSAAPIAGSGDTVLCSGRNTYEDALLRGLSVRAAQLIEHGDLPDEPRERARFCRASMLNLLDLCGGITVTDEATQTLFRRPVPANAATLASRGVCDANTLYSLIVGLSGRTRFMLGDTLVAYDPGCPEYHQYTGSVRYTVPRYGIYLRALESVPDLCRAAAERACETLLKECPLDKISLVGGSHYQCVMKGEYDIHCCYDNTGGGYGIEVLDEASLLVMAPSALREGSQLLAFDRFIRDPAAVRCFAAWKCTRYASVVFVNHMAVNMSVLDAGSMLFSRTARQLWGFFIFQESITTNSLGMIDGLTLIWQSDTRSVEFGDGTIERCNKKLSNLVDLYNCRSFWDRIPGVSFRWVYQSEGQNLYCVTINDGVEFGYDHGPFIKLTPTKTARTTIDGFPLPRGLFSTILRPLV